MKGVHIREAAREDRKAIDRLIAAAVREARKRTGPHPPPVKMEDIEGRGARLLMAVNDGKAIGCVAYRIRSAQLHMFNLVVAPSYRRRGVARRLAAEIERIAIGAGAREITVQTIAELGAGPFFAELGYRARSCKREFLYSFDRERALTTVYMVKRLGKFPGNATVTW